jgi:site-specific recombinase XerD
VVNIIKTNYHDKKKPTILAEAFNHVPGFKPAYEKLSKQISLNGRSNSTLENYATKLASLCLHFGCLPEALDDEQIQDYLSKLTGSAASPSLSSFKHSVYGLRFYFRKMGYADRVINLPVLHKRSTLPVVLSKDECKTLFKMPSLLKHKVMLAFIYAHGLRVSELSQMKIGSVDFSRGMVHVKQSKGHKDRYIPLSKLMMPGLKNYLFSERPVNYLFEGYKTGEPYSNRGIQHLMSETVKKCGIKKEGVCPHTLRHSYATHLLEDGIDIVTIKNLLGHANIETTMVYLHVMQAKGKVPHSPFDTLYGKV